MIIFFADRYRSAAPKEGAERASARSVTDVGVGSSAWLGHVSNVAKPKLESWLSANMTSFFVIDKIFYQRSQDFRTPIKMLPQFLSPLLAIKF